MRVEPLLLFVVAVAQRGVVRRVYDRADRNFRFD
jgi:hypothetical protein